MWAIFIALFGGLYWAFKIVSDRAASNIADLRIKQLGAIQDKWYAQVHDYNLEVQMRAVPGSPEYVEQCHDVIAFIRTLPGLETANFDFTSRKKSEFYVSQMVLYVKMVRVGKLPSLFLTELGNYLELSLDTCPSKAARIAFGKWVESTLKSFGIEYANLFYTKKDYASFEWEPFIFDWDKAISVNNPELESQMIG